MWKDWGIVKAFRDYIDSNPRAMTEASAIPDPKKVIIKKIGLAFSKNSSGKTLNWEEPAGFNFTEIEKCYVTDGFVRQAVDKYVDFVFKAGWDIVGSNTNAVDYVNQRLMAISLATKAPINQLFLEIADDLVKYHNVFIVKAWASGSYMYPGKIKVSPGLYKKTIAGYFVLPVGTVQIARDAMGGIVKYYQQVPGSTEKPIEFSPDDIIHITVDKAPGRGFGFPFLWQVLEDVKILRQLEELVIKTVWKNIFPLHVYTVGIAQPGMEAEDDEIIDVQEKLKELPLDGGIVIPERHKIEVVGAEGKALGIESYLEYFKKRVFTGLGVSGTIMGEGDTSNRSTSTNLDQMFKDRVKAYQRIYMDFLNMFILQELLFEGGFDPITNPDDKVVFRFREIDLDAKMAEENHVVQLFTQNAITHEEMRSRLGYDPISDETRLYYQMITAFLDATKVQQQTDAANNAGANKNQPTNQTGKKPAAKTTKASVESIVIDSAKAQYGRLSEEVIKTISKFSDNKPSITQNIRLLFSMAGTPMTKTMDSAIEKAYKAGIQDFIKQHGSGSRKVGSLYDTSSLKKQCKGLLDKFIGEDLLNKVISIINVDESSSINSKIMATFMANEYRLRFIQDTHYNKAYNEGICFAARKLGISELDIITDGKCDQCVAAGESKVNIYKDKIPPFHTNCTCKLIYKKEEK